MQVLAPEVDNTSDHLQYVVHLWPQIFSLGKQAHVHRRSQSRFVLVAALDGHQILARHVETQIVWHEDGFHVISSSARKRNWSESTLGLELRQVEELEKRQSLSGLQ
jgi:hypothetical protein